MSNIRNRFYRECAIWKRVDHTLAIAFKAVWFPRCVEEAVWEIKGYDKLPPNFHEECLDLILERDTELRSKLLHIMRKREGKNKNQLSFDFN